MTLPPLVSPTVTPIHSPGLDEARKDAARALLAHAADRIATASVVRIHDDRTIVDMADGATSLTRTIHADEDMPTLVWHLSPTRLGRYDGHPDTRSAKRPTDTPSTDHNPDELSVTVELASRAHALARRVVDDDSVAAELRQLADAIARAQPRDADEPMTPDDVVAHAAASLLDAHRDDPEPGPRIVMDLRRDAAANVDARVSPTLSSDDSPLCADSSALASWLPDQPPRPKIEVSSALVDRHHIRVTISRVSTTLLVSPADPSRIDAMTMLRLHAARRTGKLPALSNDARRLVG